MADEKPKVSPSLYVKYCDNAFCSTNGDETACKAAVAVVESHTLSIGIYTHVHVLWEVLVSKGIDELQVHCLLADMVVR